MNEEIAEQLKIVAERTNRNVSQWDTDKVMEAYEQLEQKEDEKQ